MTHNAASENVGANVARSPRKQTHPNNCVHNLFEEWALESPDRVAVVYGSSILTYGQLNRRANQVAHQLLAMGVEPETLIGISISRSPDQIIHILGILKAGCAYVPIDPAYPQERLAAMIEDASMPFLLTESSLVERFTVIDAKILCIDTEPLLHENSNDPDVGTMSDGLAYVMFTSGSTGRPKGVMVEHRSIVRLVTGTEYADFSADNVFLQFAPITFDASTFEIWGALLNGAQLAIMPDGAASLADLGDAIREYGVTTLWLTAGLFHLMVDERIEDLRPLRQLLTGGDVLSVTHVQKVIENLDCALINGYGPTENTTFTCTYKIPRNVDLGRSIPIGKPIANTQVIILDEDLQPVADGEVGELFIGGDGLARGYFNSEQMTAERFIESPHSDSSSSKLYRSGDLARFMPDGNVEFLGRTDSQVKIRGFRIELEEIEVTLTRLAGVREAVAVARETSPGDKQLIVFVVFDPQNRRDICELRDHLAAVLPQYMMPGLIIPIEALPLTPNGKVDRAALVDTISLRADAPLPLGRAETSTEQTIARILENVLSTGPVGVNENFFDLGADSLKLARFHSRLQSTFGADLRIISLFQNPTVASLASSLGRDALDERPTLGSTDRGTRQREAYARQKHVRKQEVGL